MPSPSIVGILSKVSLNIRLCLFVCIHCPISWMHNLFWTGKEFGLWSVFQLVSSWLLSQCLLLLKWYVTAWVKKPSTASYVVDAVPSYLPHHKVDCWNVFSKPNCDQGFQWKEQSARFSTEDAAFVRFSTNRAALEVFKRQSGSNGGPPGSTSQSGLSTTSATHRPDNQPQSTSTTKTT